MRGRERSATRRHQGAAGTSAGSPAREVGTEAGGGALSPPSGPLPELPKIGEVIADRYEIERSIGAGNMGHVFLAAHTALKRRFALKVLAPHFGADDEQSARFVREAQAASQLQHPSIVEITDFGTTDSGLPFFAMEYLEGEDLGSRLDQTGALAWPVAREWLLDILDGLGAAHDHGIVHRDLKPENCFLSAPHAEQEREHVKLVDFGIAKLLTEPEALPLTGSGHILGTPHYMAPEQAVGKHVDARADLYACGVMMFEMLTGALPFSEGSTMAILSQQITQEPPTLAAFAPGLDHLDHLEAVVRRAMHKNPDDRFETAAEFADAVRGVGHDSAIAATPSGTQRAVLAFAATVAVGVAIGLAVMGGRTTPSAAAEAAAAGSTPPNAATPRAPADGQPGDPAAARIAPAAEPTAKAAPTVVDDEPETAETAAASHPEQRDAEPSPPQPATPTVSGPGPHTPKRPTKSKPTKPTKPQPTEPDPEPAAPTLTDATVKAGLQRAARACTAFAPPGGQMLRVRTTLSATGDVAGSSVASPYDGNHPLGQCVAKALNGAQLPAADLGRTFEGKIWIANNPAEDG